MDGTLFSLLTVLTVAAFGLIKSPTLVASKLLINDVLFDISFVNGDVTDAAAIVLVAFVGSDCDDGKADVDVDDGDGVGIVVGVCVGVTIDTEDDTVVRTALAPAPAAQINECGDVVVCMVAATVTDLTADKVAAVLDTLVKLTLRPLFRLPALSNTLLKCGCDDDTYVQNERNAQLVDYHSFIILVLVISNYS